MNPRRVALGFVAVLGLHASGEVVLLNGTGATFPEPLLDKWGQQYSAAHPSVRINYQGIGSGGAHRQILADTVDFGVSEYPMSDERIWGRSAGLSVVPVAAGAVVLSYNLPGVAFLRLDGPTLAGIYLGRILRWDDPAIRRQNPGKVLPSSEIIPVHRSDGSGTSYIFGDYLSRVSPAWRERVGKGPALKWPVGPGAKGNTGVAGLVKLLPGALGYIEMAYVIQNRLSFAVLRNSSGAYVAPSIASIRAAMASMKMPPERNFSIVDAPGPDAYPISGITWLLIPRRPADPEKSRQLVGFVRWIYERGDAAAKSLGYVSLPPSAREWGLAQAALVGN